MGYLLFFFLRSYQNRTAGERYSARGGCSSSDIYCGTFYVYLRYAASDANWHRGAALS